LACGYPDTYPELQQLAINKLKKYIVESDSDATEYASMLRAFFKNNLTKF
jgi:hypothetical protein